MLATVPTRCISIPSGCSFCGSRCTRIPIWRPSRTACWAAATERCRPIEIGYTMPGNSTTLRTGTMTSASGGTLAAAASGPAPVPNSGARSNARARIMSIVPISGGFAQADHHTAVDAAPLYGAVAARRQRHAALEAPLRQLHAVDDGVVQFRGQQTVPDHEQHAVLD